MVGRDDADDAVIFTDDAVIFTQELMVMSRVEPRVSKHAFKGDVVRALYHQVIELAPHSPTSGVGPAVATAPRIKCVVQQVMIMSLPKRR